VNIPASTWWRYETARGFPTLMPGDIMLSYYRGGWIGRAIAKMQGRPGPSLDSPPWSHAAVYIGNGKIAEATVPLGRVTGANAYFSADHVCTFYRPRHWLTWHRNTIALSAASMAGRRYDYGNIARHLVDNLVERLTWNAAKQRGIRPLAALFRDADGGRRLVCSELVERVVAGVTGERMQSGLVGQARPLDIYQWLAHNDARLILQVNGGNLAYVEKPDRSGRDPSGSGIGTREKTL